MAHLRAAAGPEENHKKVGRSGVRRKEAECPELCCGPPGSDSSYCCGCCCPTHLGPGSRPGPSGPRRPAPRSASQCAAPRCPPAPRGRRQCLTAAAAAASAPRPRARLAAPRSAGRAPRGCSASRRPHRGSLAAAGSVPAAARRRGPRCAAATGARTPTCARSAPGTTLHVSAAGSRRCTCMRWTVGTQVSGRRALSAPSWHFLREPVPIAWPSAGSFLPHCHRDSPPPSSQFSSCLTCLVTGSQVVAPRFPPYRCCLSPSL